MRILLLLFMVGCGSGSKSYREVPAPYPSQPPVGGGVGGVSFANVKPIIDEQCALSGCHAGAAFLQSGEAFKASSSAQRINSGNMPRQNRNSGQYNDQKKNLLLEFLGS